MIQFEFSEENRAKTSIMETMDLILGSSLHRCMTKQGQKAWKGGAKGTEDQS